MKDFPATPLAAPGAGLAGRIAALRSSRTAGALGLALGFAAFFVFLYVLAMFHKPATVYGTDIAHLSAVHGDQCERPIDKSWVAEAQNTLSNLGYALAGGLILIRGRSWAAMLLGLNLLILSGMSGLYHASLTETPQILDVVWVYAALLSLSFYAAYVHVQRPGFLKLPWWPLWLIVAAAWLLATGLVWLISGKAEAILAMLVLTVFVAVASVLAFVRHAFGWLWWLRWLVNVVAAAAIVVLGVLIKTSFHWDSTVVFAALAAILILQMIPVLAVNAPLRLRLVWEYGLIAGTLGLGLLFRMSDGYEGSGDAATPRWMCAPDGAFQPHAWWHFLTAAALLLSYDILVQVNRNDTADGDRPVVFRDPAERRG
ncbi:hypothetical protein GC209_01255 [bacterium]|nr:hypothetical protein [bacterium]